MVIQDEQHDKDKKRHSSNNERWVSDVEVRNEKHNRKKKLITMLQALHLRNNIDSAGQEKKEEEYSLVMRTV